VVQEAVTNVVRHSGARHCTVRMMPGATTLALEVSDDGCGLPAGPLRRGGLLGMQERVGMVGGELHALRGPSGGLRLHALFPLAVPTAAMTGALS
jgi:two-component system sensor histidine kinase UhpB